MYTASAINYLLRWMWRTELDYNFNLLWAIKICPAEDGCRDSVLGEGVEGT